MNSRPGLNPSEIERIVRQVVERLLREGAPTTSPSAKGATAGHLRLETKLVTLASLEGKLGAETSVLSVPAKAVVTPAVRDELKTRGVELRRGDSPQTFPDTPQVVIATKRSVASSWQPAERNEKVGTLVQAVQRAAGWVKSDGVAVVLTEQPEVAACAANRHAGIRALAVREAGIWQAAAQQLGANLVVCHPGNLPAEAVPRLLADVWQLRGQRGPDWID